MAIDTRGRKRRAKTESRKLGRIRAQLAITAKAKKKAYNSGKEAQQ